MAQNETKNYFINFLNRKGKKSKIEKVYNNLLLNLKKKKKNNPEIILKNSIDVLRPKTEVKAISRFKSVITPIRKKKQINTSIKWLTHSFNENKINRDSHLVNEIVNTLNKESKSYEKKISLYKESQKFKFNFKK